MPVIQQQFEVMREFMLHAARAPNLFTLNLPPLRWFARGPRGGIYLASVERERLITPSPVIARSYPASYDFDTIVVRDRAESCRYVRPGTRLHEEAVAAVAALTAPVGMAEGQK